MRAMEVMKKERLREYFKERAGVVAGLDLRNEAKKGFKMVTEVFSPRD